MRGLRHLIQTFNVVKVLADVHLPVDVDPLEDASLRPNKHVEVHLCLLLLLHIVGHFWSSENQE